jgi:hypothetical protein
MIQVTVSGKFPKIKPAHLAFITKTGEGSNLDRAIRDAIQNIFADQRFKGKRANNIMPATFTVGIMTPIAESE